MTDGDFLEKMKPLENKVTCIDVLIKNKQKKFRVGSSFYHEKFGFLSKWSL